MRCRWPLVALTLVLALLFGPAVASAGFVREPGTASALALLGGGTRIADRDLEIRGASGSESPEAAPAPGFRLALRRDPVGAAGVVDGPNRYRYVRNNPLKFIDPDGRDPRLIEYGRQAGASFGEFLAAGGYAVDQVANQVPRVAAMDAGLPDVSDAVAPQKAAGYLSAYGGLKILGGGMIVVGGGMVYFCNTGDPREAGGLKKKGPSKHFPKREREPPNTIPTGRIDKVPSTDYPGADKVYEEREDPVTGQKGNVSYYEYPDGTRVGYRKWRPYSDER